MLGSLPRHGDLVTDLETAQDVAVEVDVVDPVLCADEADRIELVFSDDAAVELPQLTGDGLGGAREELDVGLAWRHASAWHRAPWKCLDWQAKLSNSKKKVNAKYNE